MLYVNHLLTSLSYDLYSVLDMQKAVKNTFQFVVGSLLCSKRFFSGYSGFPLSLKTNITKFQFNPEARRRRWLCGCATSKSLFIYFIHYMYIQGWRKLKVFPRTVQTLSFDLLVMTVILKILQRAKKVVSDSSGLVDFAIRLVNFVLYLPNWQVKFFEEFKLQKN